MKFEAKVDEGVFVGYSSIFKAFRVYNLRRKKVEDYIHVKFYEESYLVSSEDHSSSILDKLTTSTFAS